jgi:hypothetical protein
MAGEELKYDAVNTFFSDVFDWSMNAWGEARFVDHRIVRQPARANGEKADLVEFGVANDGRIAQVIAVNHAGEDEVLRELVKKRLNVSGREEVLREPQGELKSLLSE